MKQKEIKTLLQISQESVRSIIILDEYVHDYEWTDEMEERAKKLLAEDSGTIENPKTSMYIRLYFVRRNFGSSKQKLGKIL
jgi:hypothetical protein